jgi:hypothetical protein
MEDFFIIKDLDDFTSKVRAIVYNNFGDWEGKEQEDLIETIREEEKEDFDKVLSPQESLIIVKNLVRKQTNKKTNKSRYILNDKIFAKIIQDLNSRMVSNILNSLVQKGLVESAFDENSNDFIFWVKDNENKENIEKPETD